MAETKTRESRSRTKQIPSSAQQDNDANNHHNHTKIRSTSATSRRRWNSSSKFNQILNNLEKTIFNQFHSTATATNASSSNHNKPPISKPILNHSDSNNHHQQQSCQTNTIETLQSTISQHQSPVINNSSQKQQQHISPSKVISTTANSPKTSLLNPAINPIIKIDSMNHNAIKQSARQKFNSLTSAALQQQQRQQQSNQNLMNKGNNNNSQQIVSARDSYNNNCILNPRSYNYLQSLSSYNSNSNNNNNNINKIDSANIIDSNHDRKYHQDQHVGMKNAITNGKTNSFPTTTNKTSNHGDYSKAMNKNKDDKMIKLPSSLSTASCSSSSPNSNTPSSSSAKSAISATQSSAASPSTKSENIINIANNHTRTSNDTDNNTNVISGSKKTLNKYQQQIVSTLTRSSQNLLNSTTTKPLSTTSSSSNPFLVPTTRQLTIPPPHATDEARIENHRMIFGNSVANSSSLSLLDSVDSKDKNTMGNVTTNLATVAGHSTKNILHHNNSDGSNTIQQKPTKSQMNPDPHSVSLFPNHYTPNAQHDTSNLRPNTSPTSSAISLPNLISTQKQQNNLQGSQQSLLHNLHNQNSNNNINTRPFGQNHQTSSINENDDDDEESGFATYQSNRQLVSQRSNLNPTPRSTPPQIPSRTNHSSTTAGELRRSMNSYQQLQQFNRQQQQQLTNQTLKANQMNQQIQHNNIYGYHNATMQASTAIQSHQQLALQSQTNSKNIVSMMGQPNNGFNNPYLGPQNMTIASNVVDQFAQGFTFHESSRSQPSSIVDATNQQIYANAPPKPRRYQYYDPNRRIFPNILPHASGPSYSPITITDSSGQTIQYTQAQPQLHQGLYIQDSQQQMVPTQFNPMQQNQQISQHHQQQMINNPPSLVDQINGPQNVQRSIADVHLQRQQPQQQLTQFRPQFQPPHALVKSKSSLDTNDVLRYKLVRQPQPLNTVRDDTAVTSHQRYPEHLNAYNLYAENLNNMQNVPSQIQYNLDNNNVHRQLTTQYPGQYLDLNMQSNLSRSKSVTHLSGDMSAAPQSIRNTGPYFGEYRHSLILNQRPPMPVSSASVTRLNYIGQNLNPSNLLVQQQQQQQQQNNVSGRYLNQTNQINAEQFKSKFDNSNNSNNNHHQNDLNAITSNVNGDKTSNVSANNNIYHTYLTGSLQQQQQQQHQNIGNHRLASPITTTTGPATAVNTQQQQNRADVNYDMTNQVIDVNSNHPIAQQQQQQRPEMGQSHSARCNILSRQTKLVNGSNLRESSNAIPTSLDDKIKSLLYGKDQVSHDNSNHNRVDIDSNSIPHAITTLNNGFVDQHHQQQLPQQYNMTMTSKVSENYNANRQQLHNNIHSSNNASESSNVNQQTRKNNNNINDPNFANSHFTTIAESNNNNIINDAQVLNKASIMGNQQTNHNQYHVTVDNSVVLAGPQNNNQQPNPNGQLMNSSTTTVDNGIYGNYWAQNQSDTNSQLIVDLTTPRVLAKTQTTLLPTTQDDFNNQKNSCSINQVGLPQYNQNVIPSTSISISHQTISPDHTKTIMIHVDSPPARLNNGSTQTLEASNNNQIQGHLHLQQQQHQQQQHQNSLTRSAPYYYSDLKSDDQRRALMNIVQQKSLSPPPQLLSRSIDQSSTRLASHTNLSSRGSQSKLSQNNLELGPLRVSPLASSESPNSININRNIDRLFESAKRDAGANKKKVFQSLLTLASQPSSTTSVESAAPNSMIDHRELTNGDQIDGSSFSHERQQDTTKTSCLSSGALISKSKSLENINGLSKNNNMTATTRNPVYENITRTDKLLNAIRSNNNSSPTRQYDNNDNYHRHQEQMIGFKSHINLSEDSIDSILSSSLSDSVSGSRFDLLNDVKISNSENCSEDISQLIEQLKLCHLKLTEDYKSTMSKISSIVIKDDQTNCDSRMNRKLTLLENKSKKCEQRIQNQLALINMMEKILNQTNKQHLGEKQSINSENNDSEQHQYHNQQQNLNHSHDKNMNKQTDNSNDKTIKSNGLNTTSSTIMKAIVTEQDNSANFCTANIASANVNGQFKLDEVDTGRSTATSNGISSSSSEQTNDATNKDHRNSDDDECNQSAISSSSHSRRSDDKQSLNESGLDLMRDDEDFIEFLTSHNSCQQSQFGASQFDASQFSASDFNTSTSASESSGTGKDSLNSPISTTTPPTTAATNNNYNINNNNNNINNDNNFTIKTLPAGILKVASKDKSEPPTTRQHNDDNDKDHMQDDANFHIVSERKGSLGNVIDVVDLCR